MSDFNPLDRAKVAVHRSSFDLSSKKLFTAKIGEILPCYWQIAIPGTKYRISSDWFTRTVPVNTAAYTRIKEYYDFYAVPLRLISRALLLLVTLLDRLHSLLLIRLMLRLTVRIISLMLIRLLCNASGQLICGIVIIDIIRLTR
jgi:hypothetical protein